MCGDTIQPSPESYRPELGSWPHPSCDLIVPIPLATVGQGMPVSQTVPAAWCNFDIVHIYSQKRFSLNSTPHRPDTCHVCESPHTREALKKWQLLLLKGAADSKGAPRFGPRLSITREGKAEPTNSSQLWPLTKQHPSRVRVRCGKEGKSGAGWAAATTPQSSASSSSDANSGSTRSVFPIVVKRLG